MLVVMMIMLLFRLKATRAGLSSLQRSPASNGLFLCGCVSFLFAFPLFTRFCSWCSMTELGLLPTLRACRMFVFHLVKHMIMSPPTDLALPESANAEQQLTHAENARWSAFLRQVSAVLSKRTDSGPGTATHAGAASPAPSASVSAGASST